MRKVTFTIRLRIDTDPSDTFQMEQDLAETLQEIIDSGELLELATQYDDEEEEEEEEDEDF